MKTRSKTKGNPALKLLKAAAAAVIILLALAAAVSAADAPLVLLYHDIVRTDEEAISNPAYSTTVEKFESDLTALIDAGYAPATLAQLADGRMPPARTFILTFDDGYLSNYTLAFPVLKKLGVHADIFINTSMTILPNHFRWYQAVKMEKSGLVTVHSHFDHHVNADTLSPEEFAARADESFKTITRSLPRAAGRSRFFAYPGGIYTEAHVNALRAVGVKLQLVQIAPAFDAPDVVVRYSIDYRTDMSDLISAFESSH